MYVDDDHLAASAEMLITAGAFTLGAIAFIAIEGWMGTLSLLLGALAALGALWVARWQTDPPEMRGKGWHDIPTDHRDRELAVSAEILGAATLFTLGGLGAILVQGWAGIVVLGAGAMLALILLGTVKWESGD